MDMDSLDPDGSSGTDTGSTGDSAPEPHTDAERLAEAETRNAKLREQLRNESAKRLAAEHGLSTTQADLLALVPRDKQEDTAKKLAEERAEAAPAPNAEAEPAEPAEAEALAAMQEGGTPPAPTPVAPSGSEADILKRLDGVNSLKDLEALQNEMRAGRQG